jgi:hypothetical protein
MGGVLPCMRKGGGGSGYAAADPSCSDSLRVLSKYQFEYGGENQKMAGESTRVFVPGLRGVRNLQICEVPRTFEKCELAS